MWAAARPDVDRAGVVAELDAGGDIDRAADAALANRVGALFWRGLAAAGAQDSLGEVREALMREAAARRAHARTLLPLAMARIVEPLRAAGLEPLIFKGPAVARRYPEVGLRPMDDIDVILPRRAHRTGLRALLENGWRDMGHRRTDVARPGDNYDTVLVHPELPQMPVELHWDVAAWHERATAVRSRDLWNSRREASFFGTEAFALPPEEDLVALANHAGKPSHHFARLIWVVDLVVVARTAEGLDWDKVASLADRWRCRTVLAVALRQARRMGADVPDPLLTLPLDAPRRAPITTVLDETWPLAAPDEQQRYELRHAFADSRRNRAALLLGEVFFGEPARQIPRGALRLGHRIAQRRWARLGSGRNLQRR